MRTHSLKWLWLSVLIIAVDQWAKALATEHLVLNMALPQFPGFNLTLVHNTGAAFSFLQDAGGWQRWFFVGVAVVITGVILAWLYRLPAHRRWLACALALVLGGALGNCWDRLTLGYVIDFIDIYYGHRHWPAFNVADSAITVGAIMVVIDAFFFDQAEVSMDARRSKR